jgi:ABC-type enterochelin transport system ATPase subunit
MNLFKQVLDESVPPINKIGYTNMSHRFIESLSINNYKSIKELKKFELRSVNILIGANGSGKSNFLSFFEFLRNFINGNMNEYVAKKVVQMIF